jgi:hypothetical protein
VGFLIWPLTFHRRYRSADAFYLPRAGRCLQRGSPRTSGEPRLVSAVGFHKVFEALIGVNADVGVENDFHVRSQRFNCFIEAWLDLDKNPRSSCNSGCLNVSGGERDRFAFQLLQPDDEHGNIRRGDTRDAAGLAKGGGTNLGKADLRFLL